MKLLLVRKCPPPFPSRWTRILAVSPAWITFLLAALAFGDSPSLNSCRTPTARTERVDVSTAGDQSNGVTSRGPISASGRFVAFSSTATNLVPGDTNDAEDVFLRDLRTQQTIRVSVTSTGEEGDGASYSPLLSADARLVAFRSVATNLDHGLYRQIENFYVHDRVTGQTVRVPLGPTGENPRRPTPAPIPGDVSRCQRWCVNAISADGGVLAFTSTASKLVRGDRNGARDVFVRVRGRTLRVSVGAQGEADGSSEGSSISGDGRVVAFRSAANNLVKGDSNGIPDVFVRDWATGVSERVSVSSEGAQANRPSFRGMLSADGRFVGFRSWANNLVPRDTNRALDAFVHDRVTGRTVRVSVATDGSEARSPRAYVRGFMSRPFLSPHGRYAAFNSRAPNLVRGDTNGRADVFVHDLKTRRTVRVSVPDRGGQSIGDNSITGISADGRIVGFMSRAGNLVPGDTNGLRDYFVRVLRAAASCAVS